MNKSNNNPIALFSDGQKPYNDAEQAKFIKEVWSKYPDCMLARGDFLNPNTGKLEKIVLQDHQVDVIKKFMLETVRGLIVHHGTGTGKTFTSIVASQCYLAKNPTGKVLVIAPNATINNFIASIANYGADVRDNRYEFLSYDQYYLKALENPDKMKCTNKLVIIDEAHNFRSFIQESSKSKQVEGKPRQFDTGKRAGTLLDNCGKNLDKVLLLTATPFVNEEYDIENLMAIAEGRDPLSKEEFDDILMSDDKLKDYFKCRISKFNVPNDPDNYPTEIVEFHGFVMDPKFLAQYLAIEKKESRKLFKDIDSKNKKEDQEFTADKLSSFFNGTRRASNLIGQDKNPKIAYALDICKKGQKTVIYSDFIDTGINLLKKGLDKLQKEDPVKYRYAVISGSENTTQKELSKDKFNEKITARNKLTSDDFINILLITKAAAEGVDLKGTRHMILISPYWNESLIDQVKARGIRFKSHVHLPEDERNIIVHRLHMIKKEEKKDFAIISSPTDKRMMADLGLDIDGKSQALSIDFLIRLLSREKQFEIDRFMDKLDNINKIEECSPEELKNLTRKVDKSGPTDSGKKKPLLDNVVIHDPVSRKRTSTFVRGVPAKK